MKSTLEYLDEAKSLLKLESDYAFAKWLDVTRMTVSGYRNGKRTIDDYAASRIAEALGIDQAKMIYLANMEREKCEKRKDYWRRMVGTILTIGIVVNVAEGMRAEIQPDDGLYIMRRKRRAYRGRRWAALN